MKPSTRYIEGHHLGVPGKRFRVHSVEASPDTFLLVGETHAFLPVPSPHPHTFSHFGTEPRNSLTQTDLRSVISHVSGYNLDQLRSEYYLEEDLGIDPIKKRRILELLQVPDNLSKLLKKEDQLGRWLEILEGANEKERINPQDGAQVAELLLKITSEKTGYTRDLLTLDAQLEADLGIDSIKQAQIAASLRKYFPHLLTATISGQSGFRLKDFPTLRHWLDWVSQSEKQVSSSTQIRSLRLPTYVRRKCNYKTESLLSPLSHFPPLHYFIISESYEPSLRLAQLLREGGATEVTEVGISENPPEISASVGIIYCSHSNLTPVGVPFHELNCLKWVQNAGSHLQIFMTIIPARASGATGGLKGFTRTLALERPTIITRLIELDTELNEGWVVSAILDEFQGQAFREVAYRSGRRLLPVLTSEPLVLDANLNPLSLTESFTFIISGGMKGIGWVIALDLARTFRARFILLGRQKSTDFDQLALLQKLSPESTYVSCDVTDSIQVNTLVALVNQREKNPVGIIHAAGILEDRSLDYKTAASFTRVYQTKVLGMINLSQLTSSLDVRIVCAFSSVSGRYGSQGQIDYAAANTALTSFVTELKEKATSNTQSKYFVIHWGAWGEVGMAARTGVADLLIEAGHGVLSPVQGTQAFRNELIYGGNQTEIVIESESINLQNNWELNGEPKPLHHVALERFFFLECILDYEVGCRLIAKKTLDPKTDPWLDDHQILGVPILPATLGIEVMSQAALALFPDFYFRGLDNLMIHKAISAPCFFYVHAHAIAGPRQCDRLIQVDLLTDNLTLAYTATVWVSPETPTLETLGPLEQFETSSFATTFGESETELHVPLYGNESGSIPLGPSFHVLRRLTRKGEAFAQGQMALHQPKTLISCSSSPWMREGAFHTAALMRMQTAGEILIPKSIGLIRHYRTDLNEAELTIQAFYKNNNQDKNQRVFDLYIFDQENRLCAQITDFITTNIAELPSTGKELPA